MHPTASYNDGDIVGGSVPEICPENKGRMLLEKMGWSSGEGLGVGEYKRKNFLPIEVRMKVGKEGLQ